MKRALTRTEVAELLAVSVDTIDRLVATGELPAFRVGRQVRFEEADVEAWVAARKAAGTPARTSARAPVARRKSQAIASTPEGQAILARLRRERPARTVTR